MTKKERTQIQQEIIDTVEHPHGRLLLAPRVGKSRIAIQVIKKFKPKSILWVTPSANLADVDVPEEFIKWRAKGYLKKLTTVTYKSLPKITEHFDLIILDEEQHLTALNSRGLIENKNYGSILSMTGTPTKHRDKLALYKKLDLDVIYEMKINQAVDLGLLANYETTVLMIPQDATRTKDFNRIQDYIDSHFVGTFEYQEDCVKFMGKFEGTLGLSERPSKHGGQLFALITRSERTVGYFVIQEDGSHTGKLTMEGESYRLSNGIVHRPYHKQLLINRKRAIGNSQLKEDVARNLLKRFEFEKKIIFCNSIKQAETLSPDSTYHSKTDKTDLEEFYEGEVSTIAMVNTGGTGFTYRQLKHLIVVQADSDRNGSTSQKICRTLLSQGDYVAKIWILCIEGTQDEVWVNMTLENFDPAKVTYQKFEFYEKE